ncbi:MbtH family NRPS accessory protein [Labrenzia sp. DG1229]|uniref:MbtH family protein n=1 Tax=Labrenzia sp. DG1229 TaxID=681847 RepID=UPI00336A0863
MWDSKDHYSVVINDEEQYSIWPQNKPIPFGWRSTGYTGDKAACLAKIKEAWTDMRPLSLRTHQSHG